MFATFLAAMAVTIAFMALYQSTLNKRIIYVQSAPLPEDSKWPKLPPFMDPDTKTYALSDTELSDIRNRRN